MPLRMIGTSQKYNPQAECRMDECVRFCDISVFAVLTIAGVIVFGGATIVILIIWLCEAVRKV